MRGHRTNRHDAARHAAPAADARGTRGKPALDDEDDEPVVFEPDAELLRRIHARLYN